MRVLIATDLSEAADVALREGAAMAVAPTDVLGVIHVLPVLARESLFFPTRDEEIEKRSREIMERATAATRDRIARLAPRAELFVDEGIDYAAIVRRAQAFHADVIVVGSHGRTGTSRILGLVATKVVRHAHCSVLVSRESESRGWVLAGTDLSDQSFKAVAFAANEARRRGAKLKVVQAASFIDREISYLMQITPSLPPREPELAPAPVKLREFVAKLGCDAVCEQVDAPAAAALVRDAESIGAELVVVGNHGATGLARLTLGSVAERVAGACPCSVLIVRTQTSGE